MVTLRPHHLLCTKWFVGEGYSSDFTKNMGIIVSDLRKTSTPIKLSLEKDEICLKCPNLNSLYMCSAEKKICSMDSKVLKYFSLKLNEEYYYKDLQEKIDKNINTNIINDICGDCEWFSLGLCWNI